MEISQVLQVKFAGEEGQDEGPVEEEWGRIHTGRTKNNIRVNGFNGDIYIYVYIYRLLCMYICM